MRDDIHNKVPLSSAFRALIKRCAIPAYQQQTDWLTPFAIKAVHKLIAGGCSRDMILSLVAEASSPNLFGMSTVSFANASTLQSDIIFGMAVQNQPAHEALVSATKNQIDGMCLEAIASLRAAGASRTEANGINRAMRVALSTAVDNVAAQLIGGGTVKSSKPTLTGSSVLTLGAAARSSR